MKPLSPLVLIVSLIVLSAGGRAASDRPNILIAISDDQSFAHTSFAGYRGVSTPHFDRVAREGVYFVNAMAASPGCSPSRAALLTGRHTWQIEQAGTHASSFPGKYRTFMEQLQEAGYVAGFTGKGWGPGNYELGGRTQNPAGPEFGARQAEPGTEKMSRTDYAANFADFMAQRAGDQPFVFWYGAKEPHRVYAPGSGLARGKKLSDTPPPSFLPDVAEIRSDMADYCVEIEWFDEHLGRILAQLEAAGELENTLIIVTSDNGMPFPRAKANTYEYGVHVPLAIRWGNRIPRGRTVEDVVGFVDLSATLLDVAGITPPGGELAPSGKSLLNKLTSTQAGLIDAQAVAYSARERHSSSRYANLTYPQRALRTHQYLYIRNFRPERWPAGDPVVLDANGEPAGPTSGYKDIDASPSLDVLLSGRNDADLGVFFDLAVGKRPAEELYDIINDPGCLHNLGEDEEYDRIRVSLRTQLQHTLRTTGDPRVLDGGDIWETYPRYSPMRQFPAPE